MDQASILDLLVNLKNRLTGWRLPRHAYPEQFSRDLDQPAVSSAKTFVMIASTARCGSHYLGHMLKDTGHCGVPLEYLNPSNTAYWAARFGPRSLDKLLPYFIRHRTSPDGTFCFKTHWKQFEPFKDRLEVLTDGAGLHKILWISRRNQLSQAISLVVAGQTGVWISGATPTGDTVYDYDAIVRAATSVRASNLVWREYLSTRHPDRFLSVVYEDLLHEPQTKSDIQAFLELPTVLVGPQRLQRQTNKVNDDWKTRFAQEIKAEDQWILDAPAWLLPA